MKKLDDPPQCFQDSCQSISLNMWVETIGTGRAGRGAVVLERIFYPLVRVLFYMNVLFVHLCVPEHIVNKVTGDQTG